MSKSLKKLIDINRLREFKNKLVGAGSAYVQTAAVDQTIAGTKTFSKPIAGSVTGSSGSCTGNSATATTAKTAETAKACTGNAATATQFSANATVALTGDATGTSAGSKKGWSVPVTLANSGVTAGTYGPSADVTGNNNATISVPEITVDAKGRVTSVTNRTLTCKNNTYSVYNKTLTIQKNGTNVATFTSNSNTDVAANITVPTKVSELTNDSGFLTSHQSLSNYVTLNGAQTISGAKTFTGNITGNVTGNCSGSSGSCTGNAATATKLAAKRTIALSGAATGTATAFDGSGNITIPVTALAASAIRAQWYAAYPDGAEAHNAMWGGRDITAAFNNGTVSANIKNGTFKDIFPGDYITKQVTISGTAYTVNWVVADCDYWINKGDGDTAMTAHHVAIVPQKPIFDASMNATNTTEGGYAGSAMYKNIIPACATGIVNAFGSSHILTFRDGISNSVDTSRVSSGIPQWVGTSGWWGDWVSAQCNLMSEKMVYGAPICSAGAMDNTMATRQMSAFRLSEKLINYNRYSWWLRDVVSSATFARVSGYGYAHAFIASDMHGVRPFALLV